LGNFHAESTTGDGLEKDVAFNWSYSLSGINNQRCPVDGKSYNFSSWSTDGSRTLSTHFYPANYFNYITARYVPIPGIPSGLTLSSSTGQDDGYINIGWNSAADATSYEVSRITTNPLHLNWEILGTTSSLSMDDLAFLYESDGNVIASYRVRALGNGLFSDYTPVVATNSHSASKIGQSDNSAHSAQANESVVKTYSLNQNYPNPFNPSTMISYALPNDGPV
jgi:hypothetical protein